MNVKCIHDAFRKYCGIVISDYNPEEEAKEVARLYKNLIASEPYSQWYLNYQEKGEDADFIMQMENGIRNWIIQSYESEAASKKHNEEHHLKPGDATYVSEKNEARDLRLHVGQYASSLRGLSDVYEIDPKYSVPSFLSFWQIYCRIFRDATKKPKGDSWIFDVVDVDEIPGITMIDDEGDDGNSTPKRSKRAGESKPERPKGKSMNEVLEILKALNDREQLTAQMAQLWLKEIGEMFKYLKDDEELCATLKDEHFEEEHKYGVFKNRLSKYRRTVLRKRTDLINSELFFKMLRDNEEQLYAIFVREFKDDPNSDFDYDVTSGGDDTTQGNTSFDYEKMKRQIMELFRPTYNEDELKAEIINKKQEFYSSISRFRGYPDRLQDVVDCMFKTLNKQVSVPSLEDFRSITETLNIVFRAKEINYSDKREKLKTLLTGYEGYLKKIFYLIHGDILRTCDGEPNATLINAIKAISALKGLRNNPQKEFIEINNKLETIKSLRNEVVHNMPRITDDQLDAALDKITDMYIFITAAETDALAYALGRQVFDTGCLKAAEE